MQESLRAAPSIPRIIHFVTGGFSGATQVAVDLALAAQQEGYAVLLVLRKKTNTTKRKIEGLKRQGLDVKIVSNWLHALTVWELRKIIKHWRPTHFFAHGFSDHIWGRRAAVAEGVENIYHVEHNSRERYSKRRWNQTIQLMPHTRAVIGVSDGVRLSLIARGLEPAKCLAIPNGIDVALYAHKTLLHPFDNRENAVIMASRFARQKDHATLVHAIGLLKNQGCAPHLYLAGDGKKRIKNSIKKIVHALQLTNEVHFLGKVADVPERLAQVRIFVLSTHWEGMPLALIEAMAAGCACIVSDVIGAREVIENGETGLLVPESDPQALATAIFRLTTDTMFARKMAAKGRAVVLRDFDRALMWGKYRKLL